MGTCIRKIRSRKIQIMLYLSFCVFFLVINVCQLSPVKQKMAPIKNYFSAYKYEKMASEFPPGDFRAKRYRAIADSIRKGSLDYKFETGPLPTAN